MSEPHGLPLTVNVAMGAALIAFVWWTGLHPMLVAMTTGAVLGSIVIGLFRIPPKPLPLLATVLIPMLLCAVIWELILGPWLFEGS